MVLVAVIVVAILVVAGFALTLPDPRVKLTITDGSITGTIQGDFLKTNYTNWIVLFFNATTYAYQSGHPSSELTLRLVTRTNYNEFGAVETAVLVTVLGVLDTNLSARSVEIACNQTAYHTSVDGMETMIQGTNVSYERSTDLDFWDNSSGVLTAKLVDRTENDPLYRFSFSTAILVHQFDLSDPSVRFLCFRGIVSGWFEPEFGVGIVLRIVNTSVAV